jgi:NAD(P)-dependent dehydrogenase (short-subunit alcohol dehydrogenase family)
MAVVLITGANRGLGLEFARQYAAAGWRVVATCRNPSAARELRQLSAKWRELSIAMLDVTNDEQVGQLIVDLAATPIDVLLLNSAYLASQSDQRLGSLDPRAFSDSFSANATAPIRLADRLLPRVSAGEQRKIVFLGSAAGSIGLLRPPATLYAYRASKAALHLLARNLALDLAPRGIVVGLLNPGLADTRGLLALAPEDPGPPDLAPILKLVRAGVIRMITAEEAVRGMIAVIAGLTPERTGAFLNYDGAALPW